MTEEKTNMKEEKDGDSIVVDKKSKILFLVFLLLLAISIGVTFWRIIIKRDYIISAQVDCDPYLEKCFVWECDPSETDPKGDNFCQENPDDNIWYFRIINRRAYNIPDCNPKDENCEALICPEGEADCKMFFCDEEKLIELEGKASKCNDPEEYALENPVDETEDETEDGDLEGGDEEGHESDSSEEGAE